MTRRATAFAAILLGLATPVWAENGPRSAIPWLTDIIAAPPASETGVPEADPNAEITVSALNDRLRDGIGLLTPEQTGFPADLWSGTSALRVRSLLENTPYRGTPEIRTLFRRLLVAEFTPPVGASANVNLLLTRIDRLLRIGALSEAEALIEKAGADNVALFSRWFDVSLLTDRADEACATLIHSPMLSPAKSVQTFCLARTGDWDAAAVALTLGETLGQISERESLLLSFFLDPALIEEETPPPMATPMSSLEFLIRESVGLPRPRTPLPDAFMHADLAEYIPVRFRMEAAERLVRKGVLAPAVLFAAYREEPAASSGGVWERADAVQEFDTASTGAEIADALFRLDDELTKADLRQAAALHVAPMLSALQPSDLPDSVHDLVAAYLLLDGRKEQAQAWLRRDAPKPLRLANLINTDEGDLPRDLTATEHALVAPFLEPDPSRFLDPATMRRFEQGKTGEVLITGIEHLSSRETPDPNSISVGLAALMVSGQREAATRVATQTLLLTLSFAHGQ